MCLNIGTPNNHHFPFGSNGKLVVLGVPILKHFRVVSDQIAGISSLNRSLAVSINNLMHQRLVKNGHMGLQMSESWPFTQAILWPDDLVVPGMNPSGGGNLFNPKQGSIAHSLPLSPSHGPFMTETLLKRM